MAAAVFFVLTRVHAVQGAVAEAALTHHHPEACMQRTPSFDFCMDISLDDACAPCIQPMHCAPQPHTTNACPTCSATLPDHACPACMHDNFEGQAVGEAYSDSEGDAGSGTATGAEIFREEGEEGPQGPGVPEGAVAGVVVVQPDGSPCIGWLMAHPAIVRNPP